MEDYGNFPYKNLDYLVTSFYKKKSHKSQYGMILVVKTVFFFLMQVYLKIMH